MELVGQILSIVSFIVTFILYQMKERRTLLIMQTAQVVVVAAAYFCLGAYAGMALNLLAIVRNLIYYRKDIFKGRAWPIILSALMLIVGVLTATSPWSAMVIVGMVINTYCLSFENPQHFRISIFVTSPMVLVYNIFVFSIGGILMESISVISAVIGFLRFRRKPQA